MKRLIGAFVFCFLSTSLALASQVKITSFRFVNYASQHSPIAEICGELVSPTGKSELVRIVVDPDSKGPGRYNTQTGKDGKFCHIIATYTGKALADID